MHESIRLVDVDQHYYEPVDCCTRHLDPKFRDHALRVVVGANGVPEWRFGDRPLDIERSPRHVTIAPGELERSLSARDAGRPYAPVLIDGTAPEYTSRDVRLKLMDAWGIDAAVLFPSSGLGFDAQMTDRPDAACAAATAFNRWVEEDWGFDYEGRIFSAAFLSLQSLPMALAELERVLRQGARIIQVRLGPVAGRSPAHPDFDPFWARVQEADVPVALHITASGYEQAISKLWGENPRNDHGERSGFQWYAVFATRPAMDTFAALIFHNLFGRFPRLRILSVENGSHWVEMLLHEMDAAHRFVALSPTASWIGGPITARPSELFKRHVWVAPFLDRGHEAKLPRLIELLGADHVLFGSDWPHGEGRDTPRHFDEELSGVAPQDLQQILRMNTARLLRLG
ncbi:MAG: amidohydrolase family protein [Myxococcota bacterium]